MHTWVRCFKQWVCQNVWNVNNVVAHGEIMYDTFTKIYFWLRSFHFDLFIKKIRKFVEMLIFQENYSFDIYKIKGLAGHLKQHYCLKFQQVNYLGGPFKAKKLSSYKLSTSTIYHTALFFSTYMVSSIKKFRKQRPPSR